MTAESSTTISGLSACSCAGGATVMVNFSSVLVITSIGRLEVTEGRDAPNALNESRFFFLLVSPGDPSESAESNEDDR